MKQNFSFSLRWCVLSSFHLSVYRYPVFRLTTFLIFSSIRLFVIIYFRWLCHRRRTVSVAGLDIGSPAKFFIVPRQIHCIPLPFRPHCPHLSSFLLPFSIYSVFQSFSCRSNTHKANGPKSNKQRAWRKRL